MKIQVKTQNLHSITTDCLVISMIDKKLSECAKQLDQHCKGQLSQFANTSPQLKEAGDCAFFYPQARIKSEAVLLVNLGNSKQLSHHKLKIYLKNVASALQKAHFKSVAFAMSDTATTDTDSRQVIYSISQALLEHTYTFQLYKSKPTKTDLAHVIFVLNEKQKKKLAGAVKEAAALIGGMRYTMDLANCPPNVCTPNYFAQQAKQLAKENSRVTTKILSDTELKKLGAGAILAVGQGSPNKPKIIIMEYKGATKDKKPVVFVGKGITFDTGGNNLKSFTGMLGMKYDMCGAATVFGLINIATELKLPINVVGVIATAENMPGGDAYRPEDIITSLSGKTIEVLNTDAEGRLVLCDALTYVERYKPKAVIDIATLTGAILVTLGNKASGLFSNNDKLTEKLKAAASSSDDKVWQLPIWDEYKTQLRSNYADLANIGGPQAGSITAACFLSAFAEKYPWAHLDVAGTSNQDRKATGRPVRLLMEYLLGEC